MAAIIIKIIIDKIAIIMAFIHPVSKKCLINRSQTIITIMVASHNTLGRGNFPIMARNIMPKITIQIASVNLAFSFPTNDRPAIHKTGARIIVLIINCIIKPVAIKSNYTTID